MPTKTPKSSSKAKPDAPGAKTPVRPTRAHIMIDLMRAEGGADVTALAAAVGWQAHSVRGFIAGTLKKRTDLVITTTRIDKVTRYRVKDVEGTQP